MGDLVERLRQRGDHARYLSTQNYVPSMQAAYAKDGDLDHDAAARITALEAQVAAADRLANLVHAEDMTERMLASGVSNEIKCRDWQKIRKALAAYRAAKGE
jgi:hypothetical protein